MYRMGEVEELVLLAICGLPQEAYAVSVQQRIEDKAGRSVTMGAIYTALDRLEQKGYAASWLGEVTRARGGRRKRYYRVTGHGLDALQRAQKARERLREGLSLNPGWTAG